MYASGQSVWSNLNVSQKQPAGVPDIYIFTDVAVKFCQCKQD
jgi:hypothetical protein